MSRGTKIVTFITAFTAFAPLIVFSVLGLARADQSAFVAYTLWAIAVWLVVGLVSLVFHLIFGGKRANRASHHVSTPVQEGYASQYEPIVNYPRGLYN